MRFAIINQKTKGNCHQTAEGAGQSHPEGVARSRRQPQQVCDAVLPPAPRSCDLFLTRRATPLPLTHHCMVPHLLRAICRVVDFGVAPGAKVQLALSAVPQSWLRLAERAKASGPLWQQVEYIRHRIGGCKTQQPTLVPRAARTPVECAREYRPG